MNYSAESSSSNLKVFEKTAPLPAASPASPGSIDSPSRLSKVSLRGRIHHITWNSFSCTMATGGLALLLSDQPHRFRGLDVLGDVVFILDIVIFCLFSAGITARFIMFPGTLKSSLCHPAESLSFATVWLSIATIINNMQKHGVHHTGPWLITTLRVLFWIYCAGSFLVAVIVYYQLFTSKRHMDLHNITPSWMLPIFPIMLSGTIASTIAIDQPVAHSLNILVAGLTFQGLGLMVATLMYAQYIARLITRGLPDPNARPGMFIAVGPPSFTALALIGMAQASARVFPAYGMIKGVSHPELIADYLQTIAIVMALFLWSVACWFFCLSLIAVLQGVREMRFRLGWWGLIFPNVGFTIATIKIGEVLGSEVVLWIGSVYTIVLAGLWVFVAFRHAKAVWDREIMWPGKDEDHDR